MQQCFFPFYRNVPYSEQIKKYPIIGLGEKTSSFAFHSDYFNRRGGTFAPEIEAATADQILPMVQSDLGIGFVPTDFLEKKIWKI